MSATRAVFRRAYWTARRLRLSRLSAADNDRSYFKKRRGQECADRLTAESSPVGRTGVRRGIAIPPSEAHVSFRSWFAENRDEKRGTTPRCFAPPSKAGRAEHHAREATR